jgi:hypothetical protein
MLHIEIHSQKLIKFLHSYSLTALYEGCNLGPCLLRIILNPA